MADISRLTTPPAVLRLREAAMEGRLTESLNTADTNQDGNLTQDELSTAISGNAAIRSQLAEAAGVSANDILETALDWLSREDAAEISSSDQISKSDPTSSSLDAKKESCWLLIDGVRKDLYRQISEEAKKSAPSSLELGFAQASGQQLTDKDKNSPLAVEGSPEWRKRMDELLGEYIANNQDQLKKAGLLQVFEAKNSAGNYQIAFDAQTARQSKNFINKAIDGAP
jgi:hypothetical protein